MADWGDLVNKGLEKAEHGWDSAMKSVGEGVDRATEGIGAALDHVGAHGAADKVEDWGDRFASGAGVTVREQNLGETEQANELVHGSPSEIRESASHLKDFQAAFENVGAGMRALDTGHWKGAAADAFREKFALHPGDWLRAASACESAAQALNAYAEIVEWAQAQAQLAIEAYRQGKKATKDAEAAHRKALTAYETASAAGGDAGPRPTDPGDVGKASRDRAEEILKAARSQRDDVARMAQKAFDAAVEHAPAKPSAAQRALANALDHQGAQGIEGVHFLGGAIKGVAGAVSFGRGFLNPLDPYNLTHPAEHSEHVNTTLAGLVSTASHPERIPGPLIDSIMADPSEFGGRLLPEIFAGKGAGLTRTTARFADDLAKETAEQAAKKAAVPDPWSDLARSTAQVRQKAIHADSVAPDVAQQYVDANFPWLKDINNRWQPGYTENCTNNVVTVDRRLDGAEVSAAPRPHAGDIPFRELGVTADAKKVVSSYDDIIRDLESRGEGARSVVAIRRYNDTGHVFNAVNTPHGVVFLDGQTGALASLEPYVKRISHVPYR
ncbi:MULTISPECIES: putative T7SS-secreted protein [Streptomyces]|uniref:putative T7SS-secreted protein n=1 Tax=Streptomyces TaxID=1883 RepID=UPI001674BC9B|nr:MULTISPECIES: toxin glutamine deamidase domain-containing protein [Streptomyces]MBD3580508.1 hypothetical protein [Streptomyces sp. KD18]GGT30500.1 hypothetical protein GCM10010286_64560 [Streptomyces toxytricini]